MNNVAFWTIVSYLALVSVALCVVTAVEPRVFRAVASYLALVWAAVTVAMLLR